MKLSRFIVKTSDSTCISGMNTSVKIRLYRCLCICMALSFVSCAATLPQETYLTRSSLSNVSRVAILASASAPDVNYETTKSSDVQRTVGPFVPLIVGILPYLVAQSVESSNREASDAAHAKEIGSKVDLSSIEDKTAQAFTTPISKAGCFQGIEYVKSKNKEDRQLSDEGYDAKIRLIVKNISLIREVGDNVKLHINMQGQLMYLKTGKVVWDREEIVSSPEWHPLDYYKANGLKELDALLEKAGQNLAYDFVYLK